MELYPQDLSRRELNGLISGLVLPRPIAWVSTVAPDGARNLAPFSFFNAFSFHPVPVLGIGPGSRQGINKDSLRNARATGEFVVNLVTAELAETANRSSAEFGPEVDEWEVAGVTPVPCARVRPERVLESPAAFECEVTQIVDLGPSEAPSNSLVIGRVVAMHVEDRVLDGLVPIASELDLVGRMGGASWSTTRDTFELPRPSNADPEDLDHPRISGLREHAR